MMFDVWLSFGVYGIREWMDKRIFLTFFPFWRGKVPIELATAMEFHQVNYIVDSLNTFSTVQPDEAFH